MDSYYRESVVSFFFFFSSRRRHTIFKCDWSSDVCSSDLAAQDEAAALQQVVVRGIGRPFIRHGWIEPFRGGGHRRDGAQPGLHARHGLDAAADLPGERGGAAL